VDNIQLKAGDVVIDANSGEIGLLLHRYDVLEYTPIADGVIEPDYAIWAWEILWTGTAATQDNRYQPYTENGLVNLIRSGTFEYIAAVWK